MLTDYIAQMIEDMLNESNGILELQRNEMANRLGCVPSQISYVISSRFTPERGYVIESRRGGGGCIRIVRKQMSKDAYLMHFFCAIGDEIEEAEANACKLHLRNQVALVRPQVIVLLGSTAAKNTLGTEIRITRDRGRWFERKGTWMLPTYHPSALLRDPAKKREAWEDMQTLRDKLIELGLYQDIYG